MTKFKRAKHKKLVDELKQHRQQGETNLIIKNGSIVRRQLRRSNTTNVNTSAPNLTQTSPLSPNQLCQSMRVIRIPDTPEFSQSINEPISRLVKPDPIPVYLWNSRSLVNKLKNFNSFILTSNYKIYGITETWLSDHIYNNEIIISVM